MREHDAAAPDQMMHRVSWLDRTTNVRGHGDWLASRNLAEMAASAANERHADRIVHWVESRTIEELISAPRSST